MADLLSTECLPKDATEDEIQSLLRQLETMEDVDNCEELQSQIMETIQGYPELLMAMKQFNNEHAFEKEKVEFERLKLEEQISMLEKVIENGIKQTTDLQEIHHVEVDDLHNQIINLQKQVAAHVRFIDEHCVDSEEIRAEMQQDIDRLVVELEEQTKASRTTDSLQQQVARLEQECAQSRELLNLAEQNQKRAEALLEARTEEKTAEVEDMNSQIQWFRNEYDSLLKKVVSLEEELSEKKSALEELSAVNAENQLHIKELELKSSGLQSQLENEEKRSAEQLQMLKNSLNEEQKTSSRQKSELEKIKTELEKLKSLLAKSKSENEELESVKSENYSLATELELGKFIQETAKSCDSDADTAAKFAFLQKQLERRTAAYDDLRRENLRLREAADRRKRRDKLHKSSKSPSMSELSSDSLSGFSSNRKSKMTQRSTQEDGGSNCESEDGGYCSSLRSLTRSLQSSSMMSLDQTGLEWRSQSFSSLLSTSNSPCASSTPTHCRPRRLVTLFNDSQGSMEELSEDEGNEDRVKKVYVKPQVSGRPRAAPVSTRDAGCQANASRLVSSKTQTASFTETETDLLSSARSVSDVRILSDFDTSKYVTPLRIREIQRKTSRTGHEMERLSRQLEDKREDIRLLRKLIREKNQALAAKSAECANLKRELRAVQPSQLSQTSGSFNLNSDLSDLKINLKDEGDPELYGHIDQIRPGQIQELKTVRKTIKDVDGKPVKYSTKVSVTCNKVAVFF